MTRQVLAGVALAMTAFALSPVDATAAPVVSIEAGVFIDFVAPDPAGPTAGAIRFGYLGTVEQIAPDAVLIPPADTNLSFLGGAPTCLEATRDGGLITRLAFVASCTVRGTVTIVPDAFGPGQDGYMTDDRIGTPASVVETVPGVAALMRTAHATGDDLSITFSVDTSVGIPTTFTAFTEVAGPVSVLGNGDVMIGPATLPAEVVDEDSHRVLERAHNQGREARVHIAGNGVIDISGGDPAVDISLDVELAALAPEPPAPPSGGEALPDTRIVQPGLGVEVIGWLAVGLGLLRLARRSSTQPSS
jgi:hypothetical protein